MMKGRKYLTDDFSDSEILKMVNEVRKKGTPSGSGRFGNYQKCLYRDALLDAKDRGLFVEGLIQIESE